jgi:hypothetical protein
MTVAKIDFIKGDMGGNEIILIYGEKIPPGKALQTGVSALKASSIRGDNAGLIYKGSKADLTVKIIDFTLGEYISGCGGLTQVLGKALVETEMASRLGISIDEPVTEIKLKTDAATVPIHIHLRDGKVTEVHSFMQTYVDECYDLGVKPMNVAGIEAMRVGNYLVMNGADIHKAYPKVNYEKMVSDMIQVVVEGQRDFDRQLNQELSDYVAIDDLNSQTHSGRLLFPHKISTGQIEPSCGNGTVAVGIAMHERGELNSEGDVTLAFESGGDALNIGGSELTKLHLQVKNKKISSVSLRHSLVEIPAEGQLWLNE